MTDDYLTLKKEASRLAEQLFGNNIKKCASFTNSLVDICTRVQDKDFLLIHNPGGFGSTPLNHLLAWERSIVEGTSATIEQSGHSLMLTQHLRTGSSRWARLNDLKEEARFFFKGTSPRTSILVAEVKFITQHFNNLKVILIGASQGAAFGNAVMRQLGELDQAYSIEVGIFFAHKSRRVITERTLAIDSNGVMPDPMSHRNLKAVSRSYLIAPFRWIRYWLQGNPQKFAYCLNASGHNYNWDYPEVQRQIRDFLNLKFGTRGNQEVNG